MLVEDVISAILKGPGQGLNTPQSVDYANAFACILRVNRHSIEYANSILFLEDVRSDLEAENKKLLERSLNLAVDCEGLRREVDGLERKLFDYTGAGYVQVMKRNKELEQLVEDLRNQTELQADRINTLQLRTRDTEEEGWGSADLEKRQAACHQNPRSDNDTKW
jgi:chromosome segregation ATPase|tara:strand:- start:111 stop:605 length:495 start_codon:yes stop_codon:yes gene_type:complete